MEGFHIITSKGFVNGTEKIFQFLIRVVKTRRTSYTVAIVPVPRDLKDAVNDTNENLKKCLLININTSDDQPVGYIVNFAHERSCSLSPGLEESEGRFMVQPTLEFCRRLFGVSRFEFADSSSFICNPSGETISMGKHNLLVHGKTWYERIFGAYPSEEEDQRKLRMTKLILSEKVDAEKASKFIKFVRHEAVKALLFLDDQIVEEFTTIVRSSIKNLSWNGMFNEINNMANKRGCEFFTEFSIRYIFELLSISDILMWEIDIGSQPDQQLQSFEKIEL